MKEVIHDEIGDAKFCLIVDETRDESIKKQMAIVLRFVDKNGFVRERFFEFVYVSAVLTLKKCTYSILSQHQLDIQNIRGQGYNSTSNMRKGWNRNGLQALFQNDCP